MPRLLWAKQKNFEKQQQCMCKSGKGDWNEGYVETREEGRSQGDEI